MTSFWRDLRHALRFLRLSPGFTLVAVLTLALGIGANTAIFQLIDSIRLRTIPVKNPQELGTIRIADRHWGSGQFSSQYSQLTFAMWEQIRKRQEGFSEIAVWSNQEFNLATGGEVRKAKGIRVSGDFFRVLGVEPILGRLLGPEDDQPGCSMSGANISYAFWQRNFGGDPSVVGKKLTLDGNSFQVIGVTPPGFNGISVGDTFDVAAPVCIEPILSPRYNRIPLRHAWWLATIGRLKPGWTLARANAQILAVTPAILQETIPPVYDAEGAKKFLEYKLGAFSASTGFSELREDSATSLWLLLGISGLVLLIACANLANLMLARTSARERQITIRRALGATRWRMVRELLSESLLLAAAGSICGLLLAFAISRLLVAFISTQQNQVLLDLGMDWRVLAFTTALAVLTTVTFGLAPALRATRAEPATLLQSGSRGTTGGRERFSLRRILIVSQVGLSVVLLTGALLFVRSLRNLTTLNVGFQQTGILVTRIDFRRLQFPEERYTEFKRDLVKRVQAIPGVESAAHAMLVPFGGSTWNDNVINEGSDQDAGAAWENFLGPGYFQTIATPLLAGRDFDERDTATSVKVAIVNQAFARKILKSADPLGKRFRIHESPGKPRPLYEIVGVTADNKFQDMHEEFLPFMYFPSTQEEKPSPDDHILIRCSLPLTGLIASMKETIADMNPGIDLEFMVFKTRIQDSLLQDQLMATLSGFFGFLAALLAAIGLYGVMSYMVIQRTKEIGIRMAIGAERFDVLRMILREATMLTVTGLVIGTGLALGAAQAAKSLLYGLKPRDPLTLVMAVVTLSVVAALASLLPAYRASKLDPLTALRYE
ncbi:MAG TPA: ABC transporter permease [Candidatus Saccharimonadales bacterium]|nr:ABC transporter permease [Candidatus Saccharimonadales bacterium]